MTKWLVLAALMLGVMLMVAAFGNSDPYSEGVDTSRVAYLLLALLLVGGGAWQAVRTQSLGRILTFVAIWMAIGVAGAGAYLLIYGADAPVGMR